MFGEYSNLAGYGKRNLPIFNKIGVIRGLFSNYFQ